VPYFNHSLSLKFASTIAFCKGMESGDFLLFLKLKLGSFFISNALIECVPCWQPRRLTILVSNGRLVVKFFTGFVYVSVVLNKGLYIGFQILMFDLFVINRHIFAGFSYQSDI
jgi:hypothetical protein